MYALYFAVKSFLYWFLSVLCAHVFFLRRVSAGDIDDLALPAGQVQYVQAIRDMLTRPAQRIVVVIISGRPRLLSSVVNNADSVVNAYLPGPLGGRAIAEILSGELRL